MLIQKVNEHYDTTTNHAEAVTPEEGTNIIVFNECNKRGLNLGEDKNFSNQIGDLVWYNGICNVATNQGNLDVVTRDPITIKDCQGPLDPSLVNLEAPRAGGMPSELGQMASALDIYGGVRMHTDVEQMAIEDISAGGVRPIHEYNAHELVCEVGLILTDRTAKYSGLDDCRDVRPNGLAEGVHLLF
ncbi:autotransporter domain-containing protein [Sesbania bispinosa]|nr:autotransporter domain-containing protein [Sesbania bispinosa]